MIQRNIRCICYSAIQATVDNYATNTGGVAATALVGDSLVLEQTEGPSRIVHWSQLNQTNGGVRLITNSGHDTTRGLPMSVAAGNLGNLLNRGIPLEVSPGETMRIQIYGTNVAADVETGMMLIERKIEGVGGNYIDFDELRDRRFKQTAVKIQLATANAGYGVEEALSSETQTLWGQEEYALLGATTSVNVAAVTLRGSFNGGQKIAMPGNAVDAWPPGNDFFPELSRVYRGPFIPVFNAFDAPSIFASYVSDENFGAVSPIDCTFHLMLLKDRRGRR